MDFLSPWSLVGLVLVPAIFLWGLLAPRGRPVTVGSLLLWRRALGRGPAGKPSAKVRLRDPLLWLDAAALALLVATCARPAIRTTAPAEAVATLVMDRTASMRATSDGRSRTEEVLPLWKKVGKAVAGAPMRYVIVRSGSNGDPAAPLAWQASEPLAAGDVWPAAIEEAALDPARPVIVATDVAPSIPIPANIYVLAPGAVSRNVGLVNVSSRIEGDRWWLLVKAQAAPAAAGQWAMVVSDGGGKVLRRIPGFLAPGKEAEQVLDMDGPPPGRLVVGLDGPEDGFPPDNAAYLVLESGRQVRVLLAGPQDAVLRKALEAREDTAVVFVLPAKSISANEGDVLVAEGEAIPADWPGPAVAILPPEAVGPVAPAEGEAAGEWRIAPDAPLADILRRDPPRFGSVRRYKVAQGGQLLLGAAEAPLMVAWESQGSRRLAVLFGFDERTTDWPRRWGFPLFWSHALDWLVPGDRRPSYFATYEPLAPIHGRDAPAPAEVGFHDNPPVGVSFIGTDEGFQEGPGRDDSAAATEAIRRAAESARRAAFYNLWPFLAAAALAAILLRSLLAR